MCLRAQELGLGALWILDTCYTQEDICRYVGSGELELCCALCVGYAAEAPEARPRMELSKLMVRSAAMRLRTSKRKLPERMVKTCNTTF